MDPRAIASDRAGIATTRREVLHVHLSTGIDDLGSIRTPLAVYLAIVFICIYFAICKGVKSTGKVS